ncbi:MAG: glycosyltransferase [Xanthobacteraceae bacterium]|nr:glycosyltransferase [Xanthobacteraceae bacterium]
MTAFLSAWFVAHAIAVTLVFAFTVRLGRPVRVDQAPLAAVVVAVKGHDYGFDEFLVRLFQQDYPAFRVIFAVESADDASVPAIEKYRAMAPDRVTLVVAQRRKDEGQKTTNLRAAVATLTPQDEILVLADADIWPEPDWLSRLIEPLVAGEADAVSGFAWLIVKDGRLSSYVLTAMAASIATIPRLPMLNPCWGGSTAMRQQTFRDLNIAEEWRGTLSDDLQFTNVAQAAGGRIAAPREILLRTAIKTEGFTAVTAEARRWFMLVRIYMPGSYAITLAAMTFAALGWLAAVVGTLALRLDAAVVLVLALLLNWLRGQGRALLVRRLWGEEGLAENAQYLRLDPLVSPIATILNATYGWSALRMNRTTWAGTTYAINGPQDVQVLKREGLRD